MLFLRALAGAAVSVGLIGLHALPVAAQSCSFSLSPTNQSFPAAGGTGVVDIAAANNGCARTAASNVPWVTISFGQTGTGSGSAGYTVAANPGPAQRSGTLTIAGETFTVLQAGANCSYSLSSQSTNIPAAGGTGSFSVSSSCSWTAATTAGWLTIIGGNGSGNGTVAFTAEANSGPASRPGTVRVGSSNFSGSQAGHCMFRFNPGGASFPAEGGNGTIQVTASTGTCERPASSTVSWITINSGQTGTGNGSIGYTVAANTTGEPRTGSIV